jgi:hypothetical protein
MTFQRLWILVLSASILLGMVSDPRTDEICTDKAEFEKNGWQLKLVQQAMDDYLRDHGIRVNWLHEPRPPQRSGEELL